MSAIVIDILMITHNRLAYTKRSLSRLLETCDDQMRVWLWHNGTHKPTLAMVREYAEHPAVHRFHHSEENVRLIPPVNWVIEQGDGEYLSKVDDDCLMPDQWAQTLRRAHEDVPGFGGIGCWLYPEEDFRPEIANAKIKSFDHGHRLLVNPWINGSGFLMKRKCAESIGGLKPNQSFPDYCLRLSLKGWVHGWYYPFLFQEHMDDPRSKHCIIRNDEDLAEHAPLKVIRCGISTYQEYVKHFQNEALQLQSASVDPRVHVGWRVKWRRLKLRLVNLLTGRVQRKVV